jgi:hypothetical protein
MRHLKCASPTCPGCNGAGINDFTDPSGDVLRCTGCGGLFTVHPISRDKAAGLVKINEPMLANSNQPFYFDFVVEREGHPDRIHGWADQQTKQVVQWG